MIADARVMADDAAPKHHVVADLRERMNVRRFEDHAIFADRRPVVRRVRMNETDEFVAARLAVFEVPLAHLVELLVTDRRKKPHGIGRKAAFEFLPLDHGQAFVGFRSETIGIDCETDDSMLAESLEIKLRELSGVAGSEDHDVSHQRASGVIRCRRASTTGTASGSTRANVPTE